MCRTNNLWELGRKRDLWIAEDYKSAILEYEGFSISSLKQSSYQVEKTYDLERLRGRISISCDDRKFLRVGIVTQEPSPDGLWRITVALAYFLGDGVTVHAYSDGLPYYPIPQQLNLGGSQGSSYARTCFVRDPIRSIEAVIDLLNDEETLFGKMLIPMLQANTMGFFDVRFLVEFILLERLSKDQNSDSSIVTDEPSQSHLQSILDATKRSIKDSAFFSEDQKKSLERKMQLGTMNSKASTKDKMRSFIEDLGPGFEEYANDVNDWNRLRNKGIAHGASLGSGVVGMNDKDGRCMRRLHDLLCVLLCRDFRERMNATPKKEEPAL